MNPHPTFDRKSPEFLFDLAEHIAALFERCGGLSGEKATDLAWDTAEYMAAHWGGLNIYFPKGTHIYKSRRARQIWEQFNGRNHDDLARKHDVSVQWVYTLIRKMQAEETRLRQQSLFADTPPPQPPRKARE